MELRKEFSFEASHILPKHKGKCSRLHGHSWKLTVCVKGPVDSDSGFVMDYAEISEKVKPLIERLDHRHLGAWDSYDVMAAASKPKFVLTEMNEWRVPGLPLDFYPTSENLIVWIGEELLKVGLKWSTLILNETCTSACILNYSDWTEIKGFTRV